MSRRIDKISLNDDYIFDTSVRKEKIDLNKIREDKIKILEKSQEKYKLIYNNCVSKIKESIKYGNMDISFTIPLFYKEYPGYSATSCIEYINKELSKEKFDIIVYDNNKLFISWENFFKIE